MSQEADDRRSLSTVRRPLEAVQEHGWFTPCAHLRYNFCMALYFQADCISGAMDVIGKLSALDYEELCATEDMLPLCVADLVSAPANARCVQRYGVVLA